MNTEILLIESTPLDIALELIVLIRRIAFLKQCAAGFGCEDPATWSDVMRREQVIEKLLLLQESTQC